MFESNQRAKKLQLELEWENILNEAKQKRLDINKIVDVMHKLNEIDITIYKIGEIHEPI